MYNEYFSYETKVDKYDFALVTVCIVESGPYIEICFYPVDYEGKPVIYTKSCWALTFEQTCIYARSIESVLEENELNNLGFAEKI